MAFGQERHTVLIQLGRRSPRQRRVAPDLQAVAERSRAQIAEMLRQQGLDESVAELDELRRYVAAKLTRLEVETLRSQFQDLKIEGIWRNAEKRAFISASTHTVQARPANLGYGADGNRIGWAVLDTGIRADHPHFGRYGNVVAQWDCTKHGAPARLQEGDEGFDDLDGNGHGTHVAGIIAGTCKVDDPGTARPHSPAWRRAASFTASRCSTTTATARTAGSSRRWTRSPTSTSGRGSSSCTAST